MLDYTTVEATSNTTIQLIDNGFKATGKYAGKIVIENLKPNTNYYLQYIRQNIIGSTNRVVVFGGTTTSNTIKTLTSSDVFNSGNNTTINIWFYASMGGADGEANFTNIQLEESTIATDYVEHKEQNLPFTLGTQRIYEGSYLADDGIHNIRKRLVLNGTENYYKNTNYTTETMLVVNLQASYIPNLVSGTNIIKCSHFTYASPTVINSFRAIQTAVGFGVDINIFATVDDFKTWVAQQYANGTPVVIEYLATAEEIIPYTQTQQAQYNAIKKAMSYDEQTNISSRSNELGMIIDAEAIQNINNVINNLIQS